MNIDSHDLLLDGCNNCISYPVNYLGSGYRKSQLKNYRQSLNDKEKLLFRRTGHEIDLLELRIGGNEYRDKRVCNLQDLKEHLVTNQQDPICRHMFVQAEDSRSPLKCSREIFTYALTYLQIPPCFLDYVFSFGRTKLPLDYSMVAFQSQDSLGIADVKADEIPKLDRSGRVLRMSYLLRSVERSDEGGHKFPSWKTRQMAVYHSIDLITGRSFWLNIKANSVMKDIITEASKDLLALKAKSQQDVAGVFAATLETHLVIFAWCDADWRSCINDAGKKLEEIYAKAMTADLDKDQSGVSTDGLRRATTLRKQQTMKARSGQGSSKVNQFFGSIRTRSGKLMDNLRAKGRRNGPSNTSTTNTSNTTNPRKTENEDDDAVEMFSFRELQYLHHIGEQAREKRLVIQLDIQALQDVKRCYQDLAESDDLPKELGQSCKKQVAQFARKVDRIVRNLEVRLTQLETMLCSLNDCKTLFDGALQLRGVHASRIFQEIGLEQANTMESIANKTERQTISMHIITFITVAFLPGTFVAVRYGWPHLKRWMADLTFDQTFFQSGLVSLPGSDQDDGTTQKKLEANGPGIRLFVSITIPMMSLTWILWWIIYQCLKKRRNTQMATKGDEESQDQTRLADDGT